MKKPKAADYINKDDITRNLIKCILSFLDTDSKSITRLDIFDLKNVLNSSGRFYFGMGTSTVQEGLTLAYNRAVNNKLLDYSIENAAKIIVHVSGEKLTLNDLNVILSSIKEKVSEDAVIFHDYAAVENGNFLVSIIASFGK